MRKSYNKFKIHIVIKYIYYKLMKTDKQKLWNQFVQKYSDPSYIQQIAFKDLQKQQKIQPRKHFKQLSILNIKNSYFLIFFFLMLALVVFLWYYAYKYSIIARILNGTDFRGNTCNQKSLIGKNFLYYPKIIQSPNFSICVQSCPNLFADYVCLYDQNGNYYDYKTQNHLCYQSLQSLSQGKYCFPLEPVSTYYLNQNINKGYTQLNRIISDIGNGYMNILVCMILGIVLVWMLSNLFMIYGYKIFGYFIVICNMVICFGITAIILIYYLKYTKIYCLDAKLSCQFGKVYTLKVILYLFIAFDICFLSWFLMTYKRLTEISRLGQIFSSIVFSYWSILKSSIFLIVQVFLLFFYGIGMIMSLANSTLEIENTQVIDQNIIKIVNFNSIRYLIFTLLLFLYLVNLKLVQKIYLYATALQIQQKSKLQILKSILFHIGQLVALSIISIIFKPIQLITSSLLALFTYLNQKNSFNRFFQKFISFYPFLFLHFNFLRYFNNQTVILLPYDQSSSTKFQIYYHLKNKVKFDDKILLNRKNLEFLVLHIKIFGVLIVCLISLGLMNMPKTMSGFSTILIQNPITIVAVCMIILYLNIYIYGQQKRIKIQQIYGKFIILEGLGYPESGKLKHKYSKLFQNQEIIQKNEVTKQQLINNLKTQESFALN